MENCPRGTPRITPLALSKDLLALRSDAYTLTEALRELMKWLGYGEGWIVSWGLIW
jgi:hypothetical protein